MVILNLILYSENTEEHIGHYEWLKISLSFVFRLSPVYVSWVGDNQNTPPAPRIQMEKIFVDVDTNGGNGGEIFVWEAIMEWLFGDALLHSKIPHRTPVIEKTIEFLGE